MTGPHKPIAGGGYHEQRGRLPNRTKTDPIVPPPAPPPPPPTLADVMRQVGELQRAVGTLGAAMASSESDVAKAPPAAAPEAPKNSDPALTRAERRVKVLGSGIVAMTALVSLLATLLAFAWSYIKGYGDDRAARAVEIEESRTARSQLDDHEARLTQAVLEQKSLIETMASVQGELTDLRRYRELHRLEAEYLNAVNDALAHRRKPPGKSPELVAAEVAAGIHVKTP